MTELEQRVELLTEALFQLGGDLWSTRDRLMVLEEVLLEAGIDAARRVDTHTPSAGLDGRLKTEREQFVARLMGSLSRVE